MNWKPIETAPKGGIPVLIWDGNIDMYVAYHSLSRDVWVDQQTGEQINHLLTLWHPLPPPPVVKESLTPAMDDDLDAQLGAACSLDNLECEACQ